MEKKEFTTGSRSSVCIVTIVFDEQAGGSNTLVSNILNIFQELNQEIYLIGSDYTKKQIEESFKTIFLVLKFIKTDFFVFKVIRYFWIQMQISCIIFRLRNNIDNGFYFIAGSLLFPILTARFFGKDAVLVNPASGYERIISEYKGKSFEKYIAAQSEKILSRLSQKYSTKIILSSGCLTEVLNLDRFRSKIYYAPGEYIKDDEFFIKKEYKLRNNIIGYIGRLSPEKGILNFIKSISEIISNDKSTIFVIIGDGSLRKEIEEYIEYSRLHDYVLFFEWVQRRDIIDHLNNIKLVVLPSYTEGLPNIVLESMACGTPVLATPVGSIPDIIEDEKTGFIMENNSPACIAKNVIRALKSPFLGEISKNAATKIKIEYSYQTAVEKYSKVFK